MSFPCVFGIAARISIYEISRAHETVLADTIPGEKMMEHEYALTEAVRSNLISCAIRREGIVAADPGADVVRFRAVGIMLPVVKDNLEHPAGFGEIRLNKPGNEVVVLDTFEQAVCGSRQLSTILFAGRGSVDVLRILGLIAINNGVAFVVVALADQPLENSAGVVGIGNAAFGCRPVQSGDIVT